MIGLVGILVSRSRWGRCVLRSPAVDENPEARFIAVANRPASARGRGAPADAAQIAKNVRRC